jgi:hypothetical protein
MEGRRVMEKDWNSEQSRVMQIICGESTKFWKSFVALQRVVGTICNSAHCCGDLTLTLCRIMEIGCAQCKDFLRQFATIAVL